jgi:hypothetical protein
MLKGVAFRPYYLTILSAHFSKPISGSGLLEDRRISHLVQGITYRGP